MSSFEQYSKPSKIRRTAVMVALVMVVAAAVILVMAAVSVVTDMFLSPHRVPYNDNDYLDLENLPDPEHLPDFNIDFLQTNFMNPR